MIRWSYTGLLHEGSQPNKLSVRAKGPRIDLYANDQPLASATDTTYREGQTAIYLSAWSMPNVRADFSSFHIYDVK